MSNDRWIVLIQEFPSPIHGYWDGGPKRQFEWRLEGSPRPDAKGLYQRVGSWSANHWFHVACGRTNKQTLANARRRLHAAAKREGMDCTFRYEVRW